MNRIFIRVTPFVLASVMALSACAAPSPAPVTVEVTREMEVTREVPVTVAPASTEAPPAPPAPRTLNVQAGGGQETDVISAFLPSLIQVREGDTLVWKVAGDEIHTVSFNPPASAFNLFAPVPGGGATDLMILPEVGFPTRPPGAPVETFDGTAFASSGIMSKQPSAPNAPPNDTFSLTFTKAGSYPFVCFVHPYMKGSVVVEPATAAGLAEQADIDTAIKAESAPLLAQIEAAKGASKTSFKTPLQGGSTMWFVTAGANVGNPSAGTYAFGAKDLTIKAGDAVTWVSGEFHTVTFNPAPPPPEFIVPKPQSAGPPLLTLNPQIFFPVVPSGVYDPAQYYNSGVIGTGLPGGSTFTLVFDKPGTYEYFCAVHVQVGMKGTITVTK